jgi:putative hydrolase of the HAD superfamily
LSYKFFCFDLDDTLLEHQSAEAAALNDMHQYFSFFDEISPEKLIDIYHYVNCRQWILYSRGVISGEDRQQNRFEPTDVGRKWIQLLYAVLPQSLAMNFLGA